MISIRTPNLGQTIASIHQQDVRVRQATLRATRQAAHDLRTIIVTGLRDQVPGGDSILPLRPSTVLMRGLPKRRTYNPNRLAGPALVRAPGRGAGGRFTSGSNTWRMSRKAGRKRKHRKPRLGATSSKALINSGDLLRSITVRGGNLHYTVGVHRGARGKKGNDLVNIASIHEYGTKQYTVTVSGRMARFSRFLTMMGILGAPWKVGQTLRRKVPARPFLRPGRILWERDASDLFARRIAAAGGFLEG